MSFSPMKVQEDELEFTFLCGRPNTSPIPADEIFCNGKIKPTHPLRFPSQQPLKTKQSSRLPLKTLLSQEREWNSNSCLSSESADGEVEGVSPELYCPWRPKGKAKVKVVKSMTPRLSGCYDGSDSKRWKLKDLFLVAQGGLTRDWGKKGRSGRVASQTF